MFKIDHINIEKALLLAPMEDVTDIAYRKVCKDLGADIVYTEFVNSEGLVRESEKTHKKLRIMENERPVGIQIYGANIDSMVEAAKIAEAENPDIIDINAGCWVKNVAKRGAGAGLLLDPQYMQDMVEAIVKAVNKPVTVKTRIGWDQENIMILEVAKRMEDAGARALTIHCRTRSQGHNGEAEWHWIPKIKNVVDIPVVVNGGAYSAEETVRAFEETAADGVMIARGAIQNPWIFREVKELWRYGEVRTQVTFEERILTALKHLKYSLKIKNEYRAVIEFRKYYSGYLKGLHRASKVRQELMKFKEFAPVEEFLLEYLEELKVHQRQKEMEEAG
jgi:tRNA-dihydrouridine synthase B